MVCFYDLRFTFSSVENSWVQVPLIKKYIYAFVKNDINKIPDSSCQIKDQKERGKAKVRY